MNEILVVANWKSNKNTEDSIKWFSEFSSLAQNISITQKIKVVVCPPFVDLPVLFPMINSLTLKFPVELGAQNVSPFNSGSYTGEVAAEQLVPYVRFSLVGHSERRKNFQERNEDIYCKIQNLIACKIKPILCAQSLEEIPEKIKDFTPEDLLIMFEPAKAISSEGIYKAESPETVKETIGLWREKVGEYTFLYGGSVNESNCSALLASGINGFVVGHASLSPDSFLGIIKNV